MLVEYVIRTLWRLSTAGPNRVHIDPSMHLQPSLVGFRQKVGERIKVGRDCRIFGEWLDTLAKQRIAAFTNLCNDRVAIQRFHVGNKLIDLLRRLDARIEGIDPDSAPLRRIICMY